MLRKTGLVLSLMFLSLAGCHKYSLVVDKTAPTSAITLEAPRIAKVPSKIVFLSEKEASCPNQCSTMMRDEYLRSVLLIERRLMEAGFEVISGGVVSRVEDRLKESRTRETWDRLEKALLLGKDTGADAIFQVKALYFDSTFKAFLKEPSEKSYREVPYEYAKKVLEYLPSASWYPVELWSVGVELRLVDLTGKVIWSGSKVIRLTDVVPEPWRATMQGTVPIARVVVDNKGRRKWNYDLALYQVDSDLRRRTMESIIEDLITRMPKPQP